MFSDNLLAILINIMHLFPFGILLSVPIGILVSVSFAITLIVPSLNIDEINR